MFESECFEDKSDNFYCLIANVNNSLPPEVAFDTPANNMATRKRNQQNQNNNNASQANQSKKRLGKKFEAKEKSGSDTDNLLNFSTTTKIVTILLGKTES